MHDMNYIKYLSGVINEETYYDIVEGTYDSYLKKIQGRDNQTAALPTEVLHLGKCSLTFTGDTEGAFKGMPNGVHMMLGRNGKKTDMNLNKSDIDSIRKQLIEGKVVPHPNVGSNAGSGFFFLTGEAELHDHTFVFHIDPGYGTTSGHSINFSLAGGNTIYDILGIQPDSTSKTGWR